MMMPAATTPSPPLLLFLSLFQMSHGLVRSRRRSVVDPGSGQYRQNNNHADQRQYRHVSVSYHSQPKANRLEEQCDSLSVVLNRTNNYEENKRK